MEISVLLEPIENNGYRATMLAPTPLVAEAATREKALERLRELVQGKFSKAELIQMEVSVPGESHSWKSLAGIWKDLPDAEDLEQNVKDYRKKVDSDPGEAMSLYILDTDHLTLHLHGHPQVSARVESTPENQLAITIVSVEEQLTGWYSQIRKSRDLDRIARAYEGLFQIVKIAVRVRVLPFTRLALKRYLELRKELPRLGKLDLSIAAITLEQQGILVSRNRRDFQQVSGLVIEDWSKP